MIQTTRMTGIATSSLRFGNDPQVLKALQKIADNTGNYDISVQRGIPTRSHNTIEATNKQGGQSVKIIAHFMGRDVRIIAGGQEFSTTEKAAVDICQNLIKQFDPKSGGTPGKPDIDI